MLKKIEDIVREEQNRAGAIELLMPTIQSADLWRESGRYEAYGKEMLRIVDRHERDMLFGPTAEEVITAIFRDCIKSYKDLPKNLYNIQWKFRDEIRPRFGVMRGREFLMKDAYSFDLTAEGAREAYQRMFVAYLRTFARMGLKSIPMEADTGPIGGDLSHEFIILAETGESQVFCHKDLIEGAVPAADTDFDGDLTPIITAWTSKYAATDEKHDAARFEKEVPADKRVSARGIEVGHIFYFGTKYSEPMGARVQGPDGTDDHAADGIIRRRRVAACRRHHRGEPRRRRHHLAGSCGAVRGGPHQSEGRRQGYRRVVRRSLRQARRRPASTCSTTTPTSAPAASSRPWI